MDVRLIPNSRRPTAGLKPKREGTRPLLPQHARHCPVLEAGSALGYLIYPPLEPFESFYAGYYGEGRYQFVYYFQTDKGQWSPIFVVRLALPAGGIGQAMQEVEFKAKDLRMSRKEGIDLVMDKNRLDALIAPTGGPPWPTDWVNGDHFTGGYSTASAVAGYPHVTVPAGYLFGLPVGISFFGRAWSEPTLIKFAYAFEQATKARRAPEFLPTARLN